MFPGDSFAFGSYGLALLLVADVAQINQVCFTLPYRKNEEENKSELYAGYQGGKGAVGACVRPV